MITPQNPASGWRRITHNSIIAFAILICPVEYANSQVSSGTIAGMIANMLLAECPIATEPPLETCTPPVLETQAHVDAFKAVEVVKGHLQIQPDSQLDLSPFDKLREVQGILYLQNTGLTSISGFNNLESIGTRAESFGYGRQIYIDNNPNLTSISGFQKLKRSAHPEAYSPSIFIRSNPLLTEISGFNMLDRAGAVSIRFNANLLRIIGFDSLNITDSWLFITNLSRLTSLPSFANLRVIGGPLELYNLPSLNSMPRFQALTSTRFLRVHNLGISEMRSFNNSGFTETTGVTFTNNRNLTLISGLRHLRTLKGVEGELRISNNQLLDNVTGFNSLITNDPTDYISISRNPELDCPVEFFMLQDVAYSQSNLVNCETTPYPF